MKSRLATVAVFISSAVAVFGIENNSIKSKKVDADSASTFHSFNSNGTLNNELTDDNCDTATVIINVLDYISKPVGKSEQNVSATNGWTETMSVMDFISSLSEIDALSLREKSSIPVNRLYSGKLPPISKQNFHRPVVGRISSAFGPSTNRKTVHYGVDLKGKLGDTIVVALPGVVTSCKNDPRGYGLYICVVDSVGVETRYAHLSKALVKKGDVLDVAAPIGLIGSTGNSTGPHLHFEMRYKGQLIDPTLFLE